MAVVKQYDGYFGEVRHHVKVKCSASTGEFSIDLPEEAHAPIGRWVKAKTLREVENAYDDAAAQFKQASEKHTKVIVVRFNDEVSFAGGISFGFECGVFDKIEWPGQTDNVRYNGLESSLPEEAGFRDYLHDSDLRDSIVMPWTIEHEEFLVQVSKAFLQLVEKMREFTSSEKSFLRFINTRRSLPAWQEETAPAAHERGQSQIINHQSKPEVPSEVQQ